MLSFIFNEGNGGTVFFDGVQNTAAVEIVPRNAQLCQFFAGKFRTVCAAENAGTFSVLLEKAVAGSLAGSVAAAAVMREFYNIAAQLFTVFFNERSYDSSLRIPNTMIQERK